MIYSIKRKEKSRYPMMKTKTKTKILFSVCFYFLVLQNNDCVQRNQAKAKDILLWAILGPATNPVRSFPVRVGFAIRLTDTHDG